MIIGRFYFKRTESGNLIGEFSNNTSIDNTTESADLQSKCNNSFVGEYKSTWRQDDTSFISKLTITQDVRKANIFNLVWTGLDNNGLFWGEGFIVDDLLIGDYRDRSDIPTNY